MIKIISSGILRPQSDSGLVKNFRHFLSLDKKLEDLQQELYQCVLAKPLTDSSNNITLVRNGFLPFIETTVDRHLLLPCVLASGVPVRDVKTIKATLEEVTTSDWESFDILTRGGAVIQEIQCGTDRYDCAVYSPIIHEMIQQGKLLKFR